jgi:uncharacterized membrane protein
MDYIINNLGTIVVFLILLIVVFLVLKKMRRDKLAGKSCSCGTSCGSCPGSSVCHSKK